ncbi:hyaluronan/mRNA-binding protein, Stm1 [Artemisia annua]|uniref:Hyaluronan/mRNA-binding protein, Stm1 n=1 Tax=Artemisia annua TaxID=35608 RepID=A0A2U1KCN0_ARTAN|nr:hyaluronan/mRNA-binding protein, Stm1 [Artemisia annua]
MATANPFDLLGDDDNDDPSVLVQKIAAAPVVAKPQAAAQPAKPAAKLPSKPLPPAQAGNNEVSYGNRGSFGDQGAIAEPDSGKGYERRGGYGGPRGGFRGGRRGGFTNGDAEEGDRPPRRPYERRSGTGRGNDIKREGAGRGNWGTQADEIIQETEVVIEGEKTVDSDIPVNEEETTDEKKETAAPEPEEKEPEVISCGSYEVLFSLAIRDSGNNEVSYGNRGSFGDQGAIAEPDSGKGYERRGGYGGPRGGFRGGRRGGFTNGDAEEGDRPPRRPYERRSGTGRGNDIKREGAGRGNWGTQADEIIQETEVVIEGEKTVDSDIPVNEEETTDEKKETAAPEPEEKEPEEMTLEEYQKVLEEKRKALEALKTEERKVEVDKELASMQPLSSKKSNDEIFAKLGSDKDKRKEIAEKEERAKKSLSINEFLKPAAGEKHPKD